MLADEAAQQKAAAAEAAALQQQLTQAQQAAAASQQQLEQTAAQLSEAQQALVDADRLHSKAVRKLDKKMVQLAQEYDMSRQELLIKSAEILDLQAQLKEAAGQHEVQLAAAQDQVSRVTASWYWLHCWQAVTLQETKGTIARLLQVAIVMVVP
jgi:chromosome segregation ATPase